MNVIETRGLTKDFGDHRGLFDLDLTIEAGRVHGFLGPNGAGKTTALRLLMGFLRPDRGGARIMGFDPVTQQHEVKSRVGYVPGELALPEMVTGDEYLAQSAEMRGHVDPAWRMLLAARLRADTRVKIGKLSKGNKQKIALIDALQHRPPLLILDEPTDGLDPTLRVEVRRLLREHVRDGGTVFLSSHVVHEIQTMCDDVTIVLRGEMQMQARMDELIAEEGLVAEIEVEDVAAAHEVLLAEGALDVRTNGTRVRFRVRGNPLPCLARVHDMGARLLHLRQGDLEERFLRIYEGKA